MKNWRNIMCRDFKTEKNLFLKKSIFSSKEQKVTKCCFFKKKCFTASNQKNTLQIWPSSHSGGFILFPFLKVLFDMACKRSWVGRGGRERIVHWAPTSSIDQSKQLFVSWSWSSSTLCGCTTELDPNNLNSKQEHT